MTELVMYAVHSQRTFNYLAIQYGGGTLSGDTPWASIDTTWQELCGAGRSTAGRCEPNSGTLTYDYGGSKPFAWNDHDRADFDGDGYDDLALGDPYHDGDNVNTGRAWLLFGKPTRYDYSSASLDATATVITQGSLVKEFWGNMVGPVPDVDGDGDDELAVMHGDSGLLYLVEGSDDLRAGVVDFAAASFATVDYGSSGKDANLLARGGDWTRDGIDEIVVSFGEDGSGGGGFVMLDPTSLSGLVDGERDIVGSLVGGAVSENFGVDLVSADLDNDGTDDLLVSDWMYDKDHYWGTAHLFYNRR
jgi:hypothetical protein